MLLLCSELKDFYEFEPQTVENSLYTHVIVSRANCSN